MNSPTPSFSLSSHQAIMKCPWQWRQPFLDEKRESRKRKVGDGYFYDPVDPNFVDHLLPGYAQKFGDADVLASDEKENIQREIERLTTQKRERRDRVADTATAAATCASKDDEDGVVSRENQALVDSILLLSKSVEASSCSRLLASPKTVTSSPLSSNESSSSSSDDDDQELGCCSGDELFDLAEDRPAKLLVQRSPSLELLSDNLQEAFFAVEDDALLDFQTASTACAAKSD